MAAPSDVFVTVVIDEGVVAKAKLSRRAAMELITLVVADVTGHLEDFLGVAALDAES